MNNNKKEPLKAYPKTVNTTKNKIFYVCINIGERVDHTSVSSENMMNEICSSFNNEKILDHNKVYSFLKIVLRKY
ncbi:hypothetical protein [Poseidonibacter ostreae]|uniref:Uncharacterized protein n=1 Tax=Poseidonibacter ostreae TaxID=2654171 RepID=A0A6L4WWR6_9BACT|nr:hypothetical protein [Poseidonibacter ostreae]KAB7891378.1 hypothetical protein GBG19_00650 [Poseidonibacter ostreae]